MGFTTYLLTIFCAITFIEAVSWDGAQTTSLSSSAIWNLNPTPAPLLGGDSALLHSNDLRRRQAHSGLCGYKNGDMESPISCGDVSTPVCTTFSSVSAIGCCKEWGGNECYVFTDCINSYEYVALCGSSSARCPTKGMTRTCSSSDAPYCHRYTQSGYSVYGCGIFPTVDSASMTFFSSNSNTQNPTSTSPTTANAAGVSGTSTASAYPNRICKPVPVGTIVGSVVGGLFILVAGAVGLAFILRQSRQSPEPHVGSMEVIKYPVSPAPYSGHIPQQSVGPYQS